MLSCTKIIGNLPGEAGWGNAPGTGYEMTKENDLFTAKNVEFTTTSSDSKCFLSLTDYISSSWDDLNKKANRYGTASDGDALKLEVPNDITKFDNASDCKAWTIPAGKYDFSVDLKNMKITVVKAKEDQGGGDDTGEDETVYFCYFEDTSWDASIWAWNHKNNNENCNASGKPWPGDKMINKDGKLYWEAQKGKVPTKIIISKDNGNTTAGGDLLFANGATYRNDGTFYGDIERPNEFQVYFDNSEEKWEAPHIHYWGNGKDESSWPGVKMEKVTTGLRAARDLYVYTIPANTTCILFNGGDGDKTKTEDFIAIPNHIYTRNGSTGETYENDVTTGIENIEIEDATPVYFNLQGVRVDNPEKGIFIRVVKGKASKVMM